MQNIAAMKKGSMDDARPSASDLAASNEQSNASSRPARRPYVAPRIERRVPIVANTLVSGGECIFPGDPCDS